MNELIERLIKDAQLNRTQAEKTVEIVIQFVKDKFPMLSSAVDQIFKSPSSDSSSDVID
jgi:nucleoid DNA-binding protein